jgi:hypothetical protein
MKADGEGEGGGIAGICIRLWGKCGAADNCEPAEALPFARDGYNRLSAYSRGGEQRFFVNGKLVCEGTDATYHSGAVGLLATKFPPQAVGQSFRVKWIEIKPLSTRARRDVATDATDADIHPAKYLHSSIRPGAAPR